MPKNKDGAENKANKPNATEKACKRRLRGGVDPMVGAATQIKPGEVRNPGGRPKKKPITDAYAALLSNPAKADELAKAMFDQAVAGNVQAARELREGIEGKALQAVRLDGELGISTAEERKAKMVELLRRAATRLEGMPVPERTQ